MKRYIIAAILLGLFEPSFSQTSQIFKRKEPVKVNVKQNSTEKISAKQTKVESKGTSKNVDYENSLVTKDKTKYATKLHVDIAFGDIYKVIGDNIDKQNSSSLEFGLDFGYKFYKNNWFNLYAYTGIGVEKSNIDLLQNNLSYEYETDQDIDGDSYIRKYDDVSVSQHVNLSNLVIPVYIEIEYPIIEKLCAYADLGIIATFSGSSSVSDMKGSYKVHGIYPQYGGMELNQSSGINGFTNEGSFSNDKNASYNTERNNNSVKLLTQLGVRYNVWDNLYIDLSGGYIRSFKSSKSSSSDISANYPIHYTLDSGETFNAFASESRQLINKFSINIGVMYKF